MNGKVENTKEDQTRKGWIR